MRGCSSSGCRSISDHLKDTEEDRGHRGRQRTARRSEQEENRMKNLKPFVVAAVVSIVAAAVHAQGRRTLDIYSVDVEGGQSTLFVSPSGQSMLVDAGFPGPRDADRIAAAAK